MHQAEVYECALQMMVVVGGCRYAVKLADQRTRDNRRISSTGLLASDSVIYLTRSVSGLGFVPGKSVWDLWWTEGTGTDFSLNTSLSIMSVSFYKYSVHIGLLLYVPSTLCIVRCWARSQVGH